MATGTILEPAHSNENEFGSSVDLSSYTSSLNRYTIPNHGYLYLRNTSSETGYFMIYGATGNGTIRSGGSIGSFTIYARKGMKVYLAGTSTSALFVPLE